MGTYWACSFLFSSTSFSRSCLSRLFPYNFRSCRVQSEPCAFGHSSMNHVILNRTNSYKNNSPPLEILDGQILRVVLVWPEITYTLRPPKPILGIKRISVRVFHHLGVVGLHEATVPCQIRTMHKPIDFVLVGIGFSHPPQVSQLVHDRQR